MVVATDQFAQFAHRGQEAYSTAVRAWQDTLRSYPRIAPSTEALPAVYATVDAAFDLAERVLANQREFTKTLISVGTQTVETITKQATWFATHTAEAAKDAGHEEAEVPTRPADNATQSADQTEPASVTPVTPGAAPKRPRTPRQTGDA
jgi:hypothetical protein